MREIKFRKWDNILEIMSLEENYIPEHYGPNEYIIQYTGLKDKNGVEMFHKDYIKNTLGEIFLIEWCEIKLGWRICNEDTDYSLMGCGDYEIIGNIYENPELINNILNNE